MFLTNALWIASLSQFRPPDPGANFLVPDPRNEPLRPQTTLACRRFQSSLAKSSVNAFRCIQKAIGSHDFRTPIGENIMNGTCPTCDNTLLTWEDHISITYYYMIMLHISTILNWSPQKESCHPFIQPPEAPGPFHPQDFIQIFTERWRHQVVQPLHVRQENDVIPPATTRLLGILWGHATCFLIH